MIGLRMLGHIFSACNKYFNNGTESVSSNFGYIPVALMLDDTSQLPPVMDKPLCETPRTDNAKLGSACYKMLSENVCFLEHSKRQENDEAFGEALGKVREDAAKEETWTLLEQGTLMFLPSDANERFRSADAVHAFAKKADAKQFNTDYLSSFPTFLCARQTKTGQHVQSVAQKKIGTLLQSLTSLLSVVLFASTRTCTPRMGCPGAFTTER